MEEYVKPPPPLFEGENISNNWKIWKKNLMAYMKATNSYSKPNDVKVYILRNYIGEFGQRAIDKIVSKNPNCLNNMGILIQKLDEHFSNEVQERYKFFTSQKSTNESIITYIDNLKKKANSCNFGTMVNSLIRDKVLAEIKDKQLIEKLLYIRNLDLSKLTSIWLEHTIQKQNQLRSNQKDNTFNIKENQNSITNRPKSILHNRPCWKCGQRHPLRACPAWGFKCEKCSCYNHYTSHCQGLKNDNIQSVSIHSV
ncbi:hypothetical protein WH47_04951 [Habropoda laboriosa]|uniref:CCHC-type domain-containing protein n=1 Tax=Habropoda laboriosa TaxID=597456 RepID=A0A0L7RJC1_9HYME|nr:hypothetical protein WH47_04951 [Habropoda laboriosa]